MKKNPRPEKSGRGSGHGTGEGGESVPRLQLHSSVRPGSYANTRGDLIFDQFFSNHLDTLKASGVPAVDCTCDDLSMTHRKT